MALGNSRILVLAAAAALSMAFAASVPAAEQAGAEAPLWLRYPAISPDASQVAFVYAGQIWIVPAAGGEAIPLTGAPFYSSHPVWSPDGQRIAFSSNRHGNADIFVMPVMGGKVTRLTYHSQDDTPVAFAPDGSRIYFNSARLGDPVADAVDVQKAVPIPLLPQLYSVASDGGRARMELATVALDLFPGPDGRMLYTDNRAPVESEWRKHQQSDAARNIWLYEPASGHHRQLTEWRGEDRNAVFNPDATQMFWLSERGGSFNVWRRAIDGGEPQQVTFHERWPVRFLSTATDGTLAYAWNGELWRLPPGASNPERLEVRIREGNLVDGEATLAVNDQVTELAVSPDGSELALIARGEVFVVATATGTTRRITSTPAMERFVAFAPDGRRLAYASMRNGDWDIFEARLTREADKGFSGASPFEEVALVDRDSDVFQPLYSPDGAKIAYLENRTELRVLDIAGGESVQVMPGDVAYSYKDGDMNFVWSPDSRWLVARTGQFASSEVELLDAQGKAPRQNLSLNGYTDNAPDISADGRIVLWKSDRKGLRAATSSEAQADVFAAFLTQEAFDAFRATPDEQARQDAEAGAPADGKVPGLPTPTGLEFRTLGLTPFSSDLLYFKLSPDNRQLLIVAREQNNRVTGYSIDTTSGAAKQLFTTPAQRQMTMAVDAGFKSLYLLAGSGITRYDLAQGTPTPVPFRAEMTRDVREEVSAIFEQDWRTTRETFYLPDMQGADWDGIGAHYRRFLPHIRHWEDLAELLGEMVGELNASHQGGRFNAISLTGDQTAALGLYYDQTYSGEGVRITEVIPGGPADRPGSALVPGALILAVDGQAIGPGIDVHRLLNRKAGQSVLLRVRASDGAPATEQQVKPISLLEEHNLAYRRWVAKRRAIVEQRSDGRIGYIHIRGMSLEPYQEAYGDLFGRYADADALVVDIRANGGGNLHDQLVVMLTGSQDSRLVSRNGDVIVRNPVGRFTRPSALLVNASSYSDASVFPTLYKQKGIGLVVGERVPGTGTAVVSALQLEPRLIYSVPELGFRLNDGRWFENMEVEPDILVYDDPESVAAGRDLQLEQAVDQLLQQLGPPAAGEAQ